MAPKFITCWWERKNERERERFHRTEYLWPNHNFSLRTSAMHDVCFSFSPQFTFTWSQAKKQPNRFGPFHHTVSVKTPRPIDSIAGQLQHKSDHKTRWMTFPLLPSKWTRPTNGQIAWHQVKLAPSSIRPLLLVLLLFGWFLFRLSTCD